MSEENKTVELKDEELVKVSGGVVSEINDSIINKWYKKDENSSNLETYFKPVQINDNGTIYGEKYSYVPSRYSYAGSYDNISISEFKTHFNLSEKQSWFKW